MPITIAQTADTGNSTLTINNFANLSIESINNADIIADVTGDSEDGQIIKFLGPETRISFDYVVMQEASDVVSGTGLPVTTAPGQATYLHETMASRGANQIMDTYTLTIDYGGRVTYSKTGIVTKITCTMTSDQPLTFGGHIDFLVGTVA